MSEARERPPAAWGPDTCRAAVSVTFDNLGEAADLERGLWPDDEPLGRHFSVQRALPRILEKLEGLGLRSTFFGRPPRRSGSPAVRMEAARRLPLPAAL